MYSKVTEFIKGEFKTKARHRHAANNRRNKRDTFSQLKCLKLANSLSKFYEKDLRTATAAQGVASLRVLA